MRLYQVTYQMGVPRGPWPEGGTVIDRVHAVVVAGDRPIPDDIAYIRKAIADHVRDEGWYREHPPVAEGSIGLVSIAGPSPCLFIPPREESR